MTHYENEHDAPLDRVQDVSRNRYARITPDVPRAQSSISDDTDTASSLSTVWRDDPEGKTTRVTYVGAPQDDIKPQADAESRPDVYRAVSYGAAAPYAAIDLSTLTSNNGLSTVNTRPLSVFSEKTVDQAESQLAAVSRVSTDAQGRTYPEGGAEAWLCVVGSFCGMMAAMGIMNTLGVIQTYVSQNQLRGYNESTIGWIFSLYTFFAFFCGIQIGPLFDAYGPRYLIAPGSALILLTWLLLGSCSQYWHFIVVFSVCGGVGTSLLFTPAITAIGHFFYRKRGLCTGLAAVGGSLGGVVWPLALQALFPRVGFAWATRIIGFVCVVLVVVANLFIRARLAPTKVSRDAIMPDLKIFRDPVLSLTTCGIFCVEWGLFIPLAYLTSYALSHGVDADLSYQIIAFMNVGSCFGRWLPGFVADRFGRFNTMIITVGLCLVTTLAIWLPAGDSVGAIIAYAVIFGFASGSGISLTPVCVSQLCKVENYGRYYATCYTIVSFACLTGLPIAGALITAIDGAYWGVITFTACAYGVAVASFVAARVMGAGWNFKAF